MEKIYAENPSRRRGITSHCTGKTHATDDGIRGLCGIPMAQLYAGMWITPEQWEGMVVQYRKDEADNALEPWGIWPPIEAEDDSIGFPCRKCVAAL